MIGTRNRLAVLLGIASFAAGAAAAASNKFVSTWKAPGTGTIEFAGRKVAAVLITDDDSLRMSAEEALAREISARGPAGVPGYRLIPREVLTNKDAAKSWFRKAGVDGLVILRIVETDTRKVYSSVVWSSGYYADAWDYWGYGWAHVYPAGRGRDQRTITVETLLYDVSKGTPIWAGVSRTTDPKNVQMYIEGLAKDIVKQLEKDGVVRK